VDFRSISRNLAKALNVSELELGGIAVINPRIELMLRRQGFEFTSMPIPESLGGNGFVDIFRKVFPVVR